MMHALQQRWNGLAGRERLVLAAGGVIGAVSLLFVLLVDPWLERMDQLDRQIARKQQQIRELGALGEQFAALRTRLGGVEAKMAAGEGQFSLLPFLEEAAAQTRVRERIAAMRPQASPPAQGYRETAVEMRLEGLLLPDVLALLAALEDSPYLLQVKRVQLKPRFDAPHLLDATLLVSTHEKE